MATAAANNLMLSTSYLRAALADSATFRTWVGAGGANVQAQALARIHYTDLPEPDDGGEHTLEQLQKLRPYCIVWSDDDGYSAEATAGGARPYYTDAGSVVAQFVQDVPDELAAASQEILVRFCNTIGAIIDELKVLAGSAGYLAWHRVSKSKEPARSHPSEHAAIGDIVFCELVFEWGSET